MNLNDIKHIMDELHRDDNLKPSGSWAAIDAAPRGIIESREQYDYIKLYSDNTEISFDLGDFSSCVGKYVYLGNYFGGAAFYFVCTDNWEYLKKHPEIYGDNWSFNYGKYGRIDF